MKIISVLFVLFYTLLSVSCKKEDVSPPAPYGAVPSASQIEWQKMEYYMFTHFGPNTFTDKEWGDGSEDPKVFNPTALDCRQWAATAKAAGMKGIIITAKHHDGFCLWPSKFSTHTVRESDWKNGQGDLLRELSDACREYGLKFGVYLSPWDRNHPDYGTSSYNQVFANTLSEVLSGYGDVFEQWFDGANGEGAGGKKQVYDWPLFHKSVYDNQPNAIIFSDLGPGCRWMGNEQGFAGETNWSRLNIEGFEPGRNAPSLDTLNIGNMLGAAWVPAETDVSIRPGWFYSPSTDEKVKSLDQLLDIYNASVGRNSNLLLNVPPDRSGRIHANDSIRLMELRRAIDETFKTNLAQNATVFLSNTRGESSRYGSSNLLDDNYDSYWATDDSVMSASVILELDGIKSFNHLLIQEYIPLGQRVAEFNVECWNNETASWSLIAEATTIGYKRILHFPSVTTDKVKINIVNSLACPVINNIGLYKGREEVASPIIDRNSQGVVSIDSKADNCDVYYSCDGSEPSVKSLKYSESFLMTGSGIVKAVVVSGDRNSEIVSQKFDISPAKWSIVSPQSKDVVKAIDSNYDTTASVEKSEALVVDLGEELLLKGFFYVPVKSESAANIMRYNFYISVDGRDWTQVKSNAMFDNIKNNPIQQNVFFDNGANARFIMFEPLEIVVDSDVYMVEELGIISK